MNNYFMSAAIISSLTGIVHSVLGEKLIFIGLRKHQLSGMTRKVDLGHRQVGILWATWHLVTVMAICFSVILYLLATNSAAVANIKFFQTSISVAYLLSAFLVFYGTRGRHPGWISLGVVAVLTYFG